MGRQCWRCWALDILWRRVHGCRRCEEIALNAVLWQALKLSSALGALGVEYGPLEAYEDMAAKLDPIMNELVTRLKAVEALTR